MPCVPLFCAKRGDVAANDFKQSLWLFLHRKGPWEDYLAPGEMQGTLVSVEIPTTHAQMKPLCLIMLLCPGSPPMEVGGLRLGQGL